MTSALWRRLFDDAAIFPPGNAPLAEAVSAYLARSATEVGEYVGPFIASAARWTELTEVLIDERLDLSLTLAAPASQLSSLLAPVFDEHRVGLRSVEVATGSSSNGVGATIAALAAALPETVNAYLELPMGPGFAAAAREIQAAGYRVKMRTGGTTAEAFPSVIALAGALSTCVRLGLPFKLTAGLHNAVRHRDPVTGFEHHGFVNILAAVSSSLAGEETAALTEVLEETSGPLLAEAITSMPTETIPRVRELFTSFGTCSVDEPLGDLVALGLVQR